MMNSLPSGRRQLLRYAAGFALLGLVAVGCATPKQAELPQPLSTDQQAKSVATQALYFVDGVVTTYEVATQLDPAALQSMNVIKGHKFMPGFDEAAFKQDFGDIGNRAVILLITKKGIDSETVRAFNAKYHIVYQE